MVTDRSQTLVRLADVDWTLASDSEDIRGRKVVDEGGDEIGEVSDLMVDQDEHKVRFMLISSGGFLGLGKTHTMIPIDAISRIDEDEVTLNRTRDFIAQAPMYDPDVVPQTDYWTNMYGYYGATPYWAPGYTYPGYPYYGPR